ncbi:hypothetical protein DSECCO2_548580 [anaerobic digester metagenome]
MFQKYMKKEIILVLIGIAIGFFLARLTVKENERERFVVGKQVTGKVYADFKLGKELREFETSIAELPSIFWKVDTVNNYITHSVDTGKIISDFILKREYSFNVFNNEQGKLDIKQVVQYNRIQSFDYTFTPIHIEKTTYRKPLIMPYLSATYNTLNYVGVGGGFFLKDLGLEYNYLYNNTSGNTAHQFGVKYKF